MNRITQADSLPGNPRTPGDDRERVPNTSMLPSTEKATPELRQLGDSLSAAQDTLHTKTEQLSQTRDKWAKSIRTTVRGNPLASVAAAVAVGAVIFRLAR